MNQSLKAAIIAFVMTLLLFAAGFAGYKVVCITGSTQEALAVGQEIKSTFQQTTTENEELPQIDWPLLTQQYPDVVGWLYCPETALDFPVVQGADNSHYLTHLATGETNKHGAIFADWRSGSLLTDENTIFYGHNMNDGTMFHGLLNWGNADYAAAHDTLYLLTPQKVYTLRVFNACVVTAENEEYRLTFEDDTDKASWLDICARHSFFTASFVPKPSAQILTLSTCSGKGRWFVVQAAVTKITGEDEHG